MVVSCVNGSCKYIYIYMNGVDAVEGKTEMFTCTFAWC